VTEARIGLLGGSGMYDLSSVDSLREERLETPFGPPSDPYVTGSLGGRPVAFLSRHGAGHRLAPSEINYRANIFGFKQLGCDAILSASAVGSLKEKLAPRHAVIPDQFIDRTRHRPDTFFGEGIVAHIGFSDPVCPALAEVLEESARGAGLTTHRGGTYVCMEGPQFSTRAEARLYRSWGADVIGMTNLQEAKLAREAELCFTCLALVTDWDCWKEDVEAVTVEGVLEVLKRNSLTAQHGVREIARVGAASGSGECDCRNALRHALVTDLARVPLDTLEALDPLIGRYRV
jgi:5'-methylthioadenosine phosphorylase